MGQNIEIEEGRSASSEAVHPVYPEAPANVEVSRTEVRPSKEGVELENFRKQGGVRRPNEVTAATVASNAAVTAVSLSTIAEVLDNPRGEVFLRRVTDTIGAAPRADSTLSAVLHQFRVDLRNGVDEGDAFEDFVEALVEDEPNAEDLTQSTTILAALTARFIARGFTLGGERISSEDRQRLVGEALEATRRLLRTRGLASLEVLPDIASGLVRHGLRRGADAAALAETLARVTARLSGEPVSSGDATADTETSSFEQGVRRRTAPPARHNNSLGE